MIDIKKRKRNDVLIPPLVNINFSVPPLNQKELKFLVYEILSKEALKPPFDSLTLFRYIKKNFRNVDYSSYVLSKLKINEIVREMIENKIIISSEEMLINMKRSYYIKSIDIDKIKTHLSNISDSDINADYEKYLEKAKTIMLECLKEKVNDYDKDDLMAHGNIGYEIDHGHGNHSHNKRKRLDLENNLNLTNGNNKGDNSSIDQESQNGLEEDDDMNFINNMLYAPTAKVMMNSNQYSDANIIINMESASYISALEKMQSKYGSTLRPFCQHGTTTECAKKTKGICQNVHFRPIIKSHTDVTLGDCSYLDTCRHMEICKFVHYQIEDEGLIPSNRKELVLSGDDEVPDSQWVNCDIRYFDYSILGKFDVIMADPPWDIHMDLPYGTLSDEEMKNLKIKDLQDDGVIFLWVTGRATELARECLELWGYERKEELVWIKTNQLQRLIRTGRTGHWLNHSKEHCLIGYKGNPKLNRNIDCDVLVSEVRETSRKPDEIYEVIERMRPGGRKLELFARAHNRRKGWISLGNQLPGVYFVEPESIDRFNLIYPESKLTKEIMDKNKESSITVKYI